nr:MAG TPA: hypothetical protein [Caudoviricetes sp.]
MAETKLSLMNVNFLIFYILEIAVRATRHIL